MYDVATFYLYSRNYKHPFPRGALRLFPTTTRKQDGLADIEEIKRFCYLEKDVFINLFSEDQKKSKTYDCIFLDIDNTDLRKSFAILLAVIHKLKKNNINHWNVVFSGSKGFHLYIIFELQFLRNYRAAVTGWLESIDVLRHVDVQVIEHNRVTRVPSTINSKSGLRCIYIGNELYEDTWSLDSILKDAKEGNAVQITKKSITPNSIALKDFDKESDSQTNIKSYEMVTGVKSKMFAKPDLYPECMKILFDEGMSGTDLGHTERLELGKFLIHVTGGNLDLVKRIYSKMSDYNESKTLYNLKYIMQRDLKMLGCDKMILEGICPYSSKEKASEDCGFYPSLNHFIHIERKKQNTLDAI